MPFQMTAQNEANLDALIAFAFAGNTYRAPRVAEVVIIHWKDEDGGPGAYAPADFANWQVYDGLEALLFARGVQYLQPRIVAQSPNFFSELFSRGEVNDDEFSFELRDNDRAIRRAALNSKGVKVEVCYYFPLTNDLVTEWHGNLRRPREMGGLTLSLTAANGLRSQKLPLPVGQIGAIGCQDFFPPEVGFTASQLAHRACRYDRHLPGGTNGNLDSNGEYFKTCDHTPADCLERWEGIGATVPLSYYALDAVNETHLVYQSKGSPIAATARANQSNLTAPVPWVFGGPYLVRGVQILKITPETNRNHPDQAALRVLGADSRGPIGSKGERKINNIVVKPQDLNERLGTYRQSPTGFSTGIFGNNLVSHDYAVIIGGPWTQQTAEQTTMQTMVNEGYQEVTIYEANGSFTKQFSRNSLWVIVEAMTNQLHGLGYSIKRFNLDALIYTAAWCDVMVQRKKSDGTIETAPRSEFNGALYGRASGVELRDMCLFAGLTPPFLFEGQIYILPLEVEDLSYAPIFTDNVEGRNLLRGSNGESLIRWSQKDDDELPASLILTFEDAEFGFIQRPLTFRDPDAVLEEGRNTGEQNIRQPADAGHALGVTSYGTAIRRGWRQLFLGEFDRGGLKNNATVTVYMPWFIFKLYKLHLFKVIGVLSESLQPECPFEFFRIIEVRRTAGLVYKLTLQAYNTVIAERFLLDEIKPGIITEVGNGRPPVFPGGTPTSKPRAVEFYNVSTSQDSICFALREVGTPVSGGSPSAVAFTNLLDITQSGQTYTSTSTVSTYNAQMVSSLKLTGDGYVQWPLVVGTNPVETSLIGLDASPTHTGNFQTIDYAINNYLGVYHRFKSGTFNASNISAVSGDLVRMRREGDTLFYEKSSDGGTTWLQLFSDTGVSGDLYVHVVIRSNGNQVRDIIALGLS